MKNRSIGRKTIGLTTAALFTLSGLVTALPAQAALAATPTYLTFEDNDTLGLLATGLASENRPTGSFEGAYGSAAPVPAGGNASGKGLEMTKAIQDWAGATIMDSVSSNRRITAEGLSVITFEYYSDLEIASPIMIQVSVGGAQAVEITKTAQPGWNSLSYDFATDTPSLGSWNSSREYTRLAVFPNFPGKVVDNDGQVYYFDNISINGGVAPVLPVTTRAASFSGQAVVGKSLTAKGGVFIGSDIQYTYRWYVCDKAAPAAATSPSSLKCKAVSGGAGNKSKFKVTSAHRGKFIRVLQTASNSAGSVKSYSKTSAKVK